MLNPEGKNLGAPKPSDKQVRGNYEGSSKRTKLSFGVPEKDPWKLNNELIRKRELMYKRRNSENSFKFEKEEYSNKVI